MLSTRDLSAFLSIDGLKRRLQALAMLDAVFAPSQVDVVRNFSFDASWQPDAQLALMDNGFGDDMAIVFHATGCLLKGFDHEARMSPWREDPPRPWPGMFEGVPESLAKFLDEPLVGRHRVTFCLWRLIDDAVWSRGPVQLPDGAADPDGSGELLSELDGTWETFEAYADAAHGEGISPAALQMLLDHVPLSEDLLAQIECSRGLEEMTAEALRIGYPIPL